MGRLIKPIILISLALLSTSSLSDDQDRVLNLREAGEILPLEQILKITRKEIDGRILEVELEQEKETILYELQILDITGQVWELKIDAKTGDIIK
ncbi:MAG: hypothetical protein ISEC1_P1298 [Thiomicrorhabdus sp.]|nr:MAG: hypothetical protein ISEC1_P1298 [Thiomicrorhabdus sp.]